MHRLNTDIYYSGLFLLLFENFFPLQFQHFVMSKGGTNGEKYGFFSSIFENIIYEKILNRDGKQFYQFQQNEQSSLTVHVYPSFMSNREEI